MYNHIKEIVAASEKTHKPISELIIEQECQLSGLSREKIWQRMKYNLQTMRAAVKKGETGHGVFSKTGLTGGEAIKLKKYREKGHTLSGDTMMAAVENAIATNEVNAAMGVVCATPHGWFFRHFTWRSIFIRKKITAQRRANDSLSVYCWWLWHGDCQ